MRLINGAHSIICSKDVLTELVLPGDGKIAVYQSRHARPVW